MFTDSRPIKLGPYQFIQPNKKTLPGSLVGSSSLALARHQSPVSLKEFFRGLFFHRPICIVPVVPQICSRVHGFVLLLIWARAQVRRPFSDSVGFFNSWYNVSDGVGL
jgi:hypothetical protein